MRTNCNDCSRYMGLAQCEAFPDGIPTQILSGQVSHDRPFSGDKGLLFASVFEDKVSDAYLQGRADALCKIGKPCKGKDGKIFCIPKNSTCRSSEKELSTNKKNLPFRAVAIGGGAAFLGGGAFAAIALKRKEGKPVGYVGEVETYKENPNQSIVFSGEKGKANRSIKSINGIPFEQSPPPNFSKIPDVKLGEPPMPANPNGKRVGTGIVFLEPDNRVWLIEPTNHYGGTKFTFPKGGLEPDLTPQQNARKEAWEEAGLKGELVGHLIDTETPKSMGRYYLGNRTGGDPKLHGWESQSVRLVSIPEARKLLNQQRDQDILTALEERLTKEGRTAQKPLIDNKGLPSSPNDIKLLNKIGDLNGSTKPELFQDVYSGNKYVVKRGGNPKHLREESLADNLYRSAGLKTPESRLFEGVPPVKVSQFLEGKTIESLKGKEKAEALRELRKGYVVDALLGNWDVAGQAGNNILREKDGSLSRIDNGGSLRYRAQGGLKSDFSATPLDLWTMRDKGNAGGRFFSDLSWSDIEDQIPNVVNKKDQIVSTARGQSPDLASTLEARIENLASMSKASRQIRAKGGRDRDIDKYFRKSFEKSKNKIVSAESLSQGWSKYRKDSTQIMSSVLMNVNLDGSPNCGSASKPCKTASGKVVCIPKNRECRSESEFVKGAKRGAGFAASSIAGGAAAALGAIAVEKALKVNRGATVNIKNKTTVKEAPIKEIRKKSKAERSPDEVAVIQEARAGLVSRLLVRKLAATSGLDVKPEEEGFLADEIQDIIKEYKNKKRG